MQRFIKETEVDGLEKLLGQTVELWCLNYIYCGELVGVNTTDVCLKGAKVVYETGELRCDTFKDAQPVHNQKEWYVRTATIESYGAR